MALLEVLVPLQLSLYGQLGQRIDRVEVRLDTLESRLDSPSERVARIGGCLDAVLLAITLTSPELTSSDQ